MPSSLHPKIVASLIAQHLQRDPPSQLIFTTHDTHLMDTKLLRRDQFWITERDVNGSTQLRSIHDFEGRESEDVEKRYYEGRYRGLVLPPLRPFVFVVMVYPSPRLCATRHSSRQLRGQRACGVEVWCRA